MQSSGEAGVVLVTFGSMITNLTSERAEVMAAAFGRLPQKVTIVTTARFHLGCTEKTEKMIKMSRAGVQTRIRMRHKHLRWLHIRINLPNPEKKYFTFFYGFKGKVVPTDID